MNSLIILFIFIIGLIFGSFFNVCIYRIPRGENIAFPPSHCTNCNNKLKPLELIPVISYIILRGKCKNCSSKISIMYPLIEVLNGIIYVLIYIKFGLTLNFVKYIILFSILLIASIIDIKTQEVYFNISLTGFIVGVIFLTIEMVYGKELKTNLISILIPLIIIGLIYLIAKRFDGFGSGDLEVYLMISLYINPMLIGLSIFFSIILGGIVAIILLILGKRKAYIPFVPFISLGTLVSVFFGCQVLNWYIGLF